MGSKMDRFEPFQDLDEVPTELLLDLLALEASGLEARFPRARGSRLEARGGGGVGQIGGAQGNSSWVGRFGSACQKQSPFLVVFSRKHGEGFFRWVHLSCSHESHYKVSLQGIIIMKVIARSHCKESLQGVIARSHCKESWQGLQLALDSLHLQLALDSLHLQLALDSMHCNLRLAPCTWLLALGSLHLAPCTCNLHLTPCTCDLHLTPCTWLLATCNGSHDSLQ